MLSDFLKDKREKVAQARLLEPIDRDSEYLYGLITALTFTCTLSAFDLAKNDVGTVVLSALACNVAAGILDAVMYLLSCLAERGRNLLALRQVRGAKSADELSAIIEDALPDSVAAVLSPQELDTLRQRIAALPPPADRARLDRRDYLAALALFTIAVLATIPVVLPLILIREQGIAIRVSNATAILLLYFFGRALGKATGNPSRLTEFTMVSIGIVLVAITILLGG
jgi:VIT1/CCC1 family predicted Fe2+/Mn2+ transporter